MCTLRESFAAHMTPEILSSTAFVAVMSDLMDTDPNEMIKFEEEDINKSKKLTNKKSICRN